VNTVPPGIWGKNKLNIVLSGPFPKTDEHPCIHELCSHLTACPN